MCERAVATILARNRISNGMTPVSLFLRWSVRTANRCREGGGIQARRFQPAPSQLLRQAQCAEKDGGNLCGGASAIADGVRFVSTAPIGPNENDVSELSGRDASRSGRGEGGAPTSRSTGTSSKTCDGECKGESEGEYHLAVFNVGKLLSPLSSAQMKEFQSAIGPVNALAKSTPGFLWMYGSDGGGTNFGRTSSASTGVPELDADPLLMPQLSLWTGPEPLRHFVMKSGHSSYLRRRKEWFAHLEKPYAVCWYRDATLGEDARPTLAEAYMRLRMLKERQEQRGGNVVCADWDAFDFKALVGKGGPPQPPLSTEEHASGAKS